MDKLRQSYYRCLTRSIFMMLVTVACWGASSNTFALTATATSNSPICSGQDLHLWGSGSGGTLPYSYYWTGPFFFEAWSPNVTLLTASTLSSGTYTLVVTDALGNTASTTISVTVTEIPTATVQYFGTPYCTSDAPDNPTVIGSGAYSGGTFRATPTGLTINPASGQITPSTSSAGTYTVTYTIPASGGCDTVPVTAMVVIEEAPSATIAYSGTPFCKSITTPQPVTRSGTAGGTYSATPAGLSIDPVTGAVTPSTSAANLYTVTYSIAATGACPSFQTTNSVRINDLPTLTPGANPSVCLGALTAGLTYGATTGSPDQYSISWDAAGLAAGFVNIPNNALPASPIPLSVPGTATTGTYSGTLTVHNSATGCSSGGIPFTVTINPVPAPAFIYHD